MAQVRNSTYGSAYSANGKFEAWARAGFAAKGIVYILVGVLALMAALGEGGQTTGSKGAISTLADEPFGQFALIVIGVGLIGYALWRMVSSVTDSEGNGSSPKGLAKRTGHFISGLIYSGTAIFALRLAMGNGGQGGGQSDKAQGWTAELLSAPYGVFLVVALGVAIVVGGIFQMRHGWKEKFRRHFRSLSQSQDWLIKAGKWGYVARGIVFSIIGGFVVIAALRHDAGRVRGMEGALDAVAAQPFGQILLGLVAAGLVCYGVYCVASAKYRDV